VYFHLFVGAGETHGIRNKATKLSSAQYPTRAGMDSYECKGTAEEGQGVCSVFSRSTCKTEVQKVIHLNIS